MVENARGLSIVSSAALVWMSGAAPLASQLMPVLMPVMQQELHIEPQALSLLASANLVGTLVAAMSSPLVLSRISSRQSILLGLAVIMVATGVEAFAATSTVLLLAMLVAGFGTGLVLFGALPLLALAARPARLVSAIQVFQLVTAAGALSGAGWLLSFADLREVLLVVVAVAMISIPIALLLPARGAANSHHLPTLAELRPGAAALLAIFIYFASIAILTNYTGKLGVQNGLSIAFVGSAMAIGNFGALPGSLIAALANDVPRQRWMLGAATLLEGVTVVALLLWAHDEVIFTSAFFLMQVCITIIVPLQVALLISQDTSRRSIQAMGMMQALGQAIGPLTVTFSVTSSSIDNAYYWAILYVGLSAALIVRPTLQRRPATS